MFFLFYSQICDRIQATGNYILLSLFKICFRIQYIWKLVVPELQASQKSILSVLSINDIECLSASPLYSRQYTSVQKDGSEFTSDLKRFKTGISYLWCKVLWELSHAADFSFSSPPDFFRLITFQFMVISH